MPLLIKRNRIFWLKYYLAIAVSLITFAVYLPALQNEFIGWDDGTYIIENVHIRSLNGALLKWALFDFYASNWHPLTWMSHALDFAVWGLNPIGHHLTNNILHALNTFLVVLLVMRLLEASRKLANNKISPNPSRDHNSPFPPLILRGGAKPTVGALSSGGVIPKRGTSALPPLEKGDRGGFSDNSVLIVAATTGLLFGLHPVHVESVAWVSERKDLLCALFYLLSVMAYVKYADAISHRAKDIEHSEKYNMQRAVSSIRYALGPMLSFKGPLLYALCFFVLALMSKPMAVSLPFVLLVLDWYPLGRISSLKTFRTSFVEKLPFIALSFFSSVITMLAQRSGEAIKSTEFATVSTRLLVAGKSLITYLWKMVLPLNLLPFYPYPQKISLLSVEYLLPIAIIIGLSIACVVTARKQGLWMSIWGYYVVTLIPVLGFVQVGDQSMADRYTYLPGLGPFLMVGLLAGWVSNKLDVLNKLWRPLKIFGITAAIFVPLCISYFTIQQIGVWKNSMTLWNFVIEKDPERVPFAYYNRGLVFAKMGQYQRSIEDFDRAISLIPFGYSEYYNNRGVSYMNESLFDKAIEDFQIAVAIDPSNNSAYYNRGLAYYRRGSAFLLESKKEIAIAAFQKACNLGNKKGCDILQALGS